MKSVSTVSTVQWFKRADRTLGSRPVAVEVGVEVSGTRAAAGAEKRELFGENTNTTLVFEDGAVVRLSAPVEVGQLLFLKHIASQKEIVARVLRQRSFGVAGGAYVELEFTEAVPGFWGELPLIEEAVAEGAESQTVAAEFLAEDAAEKKLPAAKPDDGEVARLRDEIAGLRTQMSSLLETSTTPKRSLVPMLMQANAEPDSRAGQQAEQAVDAEAMQVGEGAPKAAENGAGAPAPEKKQVPYKMMAAGLLVAVLTGAAYYEGYLRNLPWKWRVTADYLSALSSSRRALPAAPPAAVRPAGSATTKNTAAALRKDGTAVVATPETAHDVEMDARNGADGSQPGDNPSSRKSEVRAEHQGKSGDETLRGGKGIAAGPAEGGDNVEVPPSLIKAVNPVAPPEAVRGFVTGDVKCDALVDATGKVASAKVISGPAALRAAALEQLRLYQYKPAMKNGRPVPAHVEVTMKFWYEP